MSDLRLAPDEIRQTIVECLRDKSRHFLDGNGPSRRYISEWNIRQNALISELANDLEIYHLYLKPRQKPTDLQRYQFVMRWDGDERYLLIHFTLSPKGTPPRVMVACHEHNIGYPPLPLKTITPPPDDN